MTWVCLFDKGVTLRSIVLVSGNQAAQAVFALRNSFLFLGELMLQFFIRFVHLIHLPAGCLEHCTGTDLSTADSRRGTFVARSRGRWRTFAQGSTLFLQNAMHLLGTLSEV